jgi:transcriptional regulator with XRE-family HTH domain
MKTSRQFKNPNGLAATRQRLGMTQRDIALSLGISKALVSMAEGNRRTLPPECLVKLASLEVAVGGAVSIASTQTPHPVEVESHFLNANAPVMLEYKEMHCRAEARILENKLELMVRRYTELRASLEAIERMIAAIGDCPHSNMLASLQVHRYKLCRKITVYSLLAQASVRNKIALAYAAAELHKSVREKYHGREETGEGRG